MSELAEQVAAIAFPHTNSTRPDWPMAVDISQRVIDAYLEVTA